MSIWYRLPEHAELPVVNVAADVNHVGSIGVGDTSAAAAAEQSNQVSIHDTIVTDTNGGVCAFVGKQL